MIFGSGGTQVSSMISDSDVVYGAEDSASAMEQGYGDDFCVLRDAVFVNDF